MGLRAVQLKGFSSKNNSLKLAVEELHSNKVFELAG